MPTDPAGRCFVSYRRTQRDHVGALVSALQRHGVPTWVDIQNLGAEATNDELRRILADERTASAVLWLSPDVRDSPTIRTVELPSILEREGRRDGFFIFPILSDLSYDQVDGLVGAQPTLVAFKNRNMKKFTGTTDEANAFAATILRERVRKIHATLPADEALRISLHTFAPPSDPPGAHLALNFAPHFEGRHAAESDWQRLLLPALRTVLNIVEHEAPGRSIELSGPAALSIAFATGALTVEPRGLRICWKQPHPGGKAERWSLHGERSSVDLNCPPPRPDDAGSANLAVLVSIADDVRPAYARFRATGFVARASFEAAAAKFPLYLRDSNEAREAARRIGDGIRSAIRANGPVEMVHVFLAVPAGLAFLIGQLSNTLPEVQLYELVSQPGLPTTYKKSVRLIPGAFSTGEREAV